MASPLPCLPPSLFRVWVPSWDLGLWTGEKSLGVPKEEEEEEEVSWVSHACMHIKFPGETHCPGLESWMD